MNALQNVKVVNVTPPAAIVDNASFTTNTIDTAGFGKLAVYFSLGATDIAMAALKLQESDDSGMSGAADITGCVYGATGAPALPTATDDNKVFGFFVNLAGRDRYIDVVATAGDGSTGTFGSCIAVLYNGEGINDATERGLAANIIKD
jgi:hypothetical protein